MISRYKSRAGRSARWGAVTLALALALPALGQGLSGDINLDGGINILDVQRSVNQALMFTPETPEANVDGNGEVNVVDVQNIINTVLGEGGLTQVVHAAIHTNSNGAQALRIIGVSTSGLYIEKDIADTNISLKLRSMQGWTFAIFGDSGGGEFDELLGTVLVPAGMSSSSALPIPSLSVGNVLDLGNLDISGPTAASPSISAAIAAMAAPLDNTDADGNGLPDFIDEIVDAVIDSPHVPNSVDTDGLKMTVGDCLDGIGADFSTPDPTDTDGNGVPDFLEPVVTCIGDNLADWFPGQGLNPPNNDNNGNGRPDFIDDTIEAVVAAVPVVLEGTGRPEFVDENGNGVPDFAEQFAALQGQPSELDEDGDGVPDFAEDDDGDGIPNIADPDSHVTLDSDGDGIPDVADWDDDNDGQPDYADAAPTDPEVQ